MVKTKWPRFVLAKGTLELLVTIQVYYYILVATLFIKHCTSPLYTFHPMYCTQK